MDKTTKSDADYDISSRLLDSELSLVVTAKHRIYLRTRSRDLLVGQYTSDTIQAASDAAASGIKVYSNLYPRPARGRPQKEAPALPPVAPMDYSRQLPKGIYQRGKKFVVTYPVYRGYHDTLELAIAAQNYTPPDLKAALTKEATRKERHDLKKPR